MNKDDAGRLDWVCENRVSVRVAGAGGEWRVYDYDANRYIGFGNTSREAIDNAMSNYGDDK